MRPPNLFRKVVVWEAEVTHNDRGSEDPRYTVILPFR